MGSESLTGTALDAAIERVVFSDDRSAFAADGTPIERRLRAAYAHCVSVYTTAGGLSVSVRPGLEWVGRTVVPPQHEDRPGIWDAEWLWNQRHGQPFGEGLEQIVAKFRVLPRPFHRDLRLAMGLLMETVHKKGRKFIIQDHDKIFPDEADIYVDLFGFSGGPIRGVARWDEFPDADEAEQRVLAACAAICRAVLSKESVK